MKFLLTFLIFNLSFSYTANASINISERLKLRNELFIATEKELEPRKETDTKKEIDLKKIRAYLFDQEVLQRLDNWITYKENESYVVDCQGYLRPYFSAPKILAPLCYFLRQDDIEKRKQYYEFVKLYLLENRAIYFELSNDPRLDEKLQKKAKTYYEYSKSLDEKALQGCFSTALAANYNKHQDGYSPFSMVKPCLSNTFKVQGDIAKIPFLEINIQKTFGGAQPGHAVSATGWIPGNETTYLYDNYLYGNDFGGKLADDLETLQDIMTSLYPLSGRGSYKAMLDQLEKDQLEKDQIEKYQSKIFTSAEGFADAKNHPVWRQKAPSIFGELLSSFDKAQESIFIDIFFLGGTMGASLAKHLVSLSEDREHRPNLKILILRDLDNHFGHKEEMMPVYNFLKAYSYLHPDRLLISKSHISSHFSGLPDFLTDVISDDFLNAVGLKDRLPLSSEVKSDHSKVVVIDGKTSRPIAFVGSKNWTDSSGAVCYDEVVKIVGPAAAVVQDDYYFDMFYALNYEFGPEDKADDTWLDHFLTKGWAKVKDQKNISREKKIALILQPFDLLNRNGNFESQLKGGLELPEAGTTLLRTGYNNIDSTQNNALAQVIQLIQSAQTNIYIKDQYLFERNIVLALLRAKEKNPGLDIRILLEPLDRANPKHMPNLLYADILKDAGIQIRFKKVIENKIVVQEYHMKTISADGKFVISGSANKDQTTMYGSFREEQVDVFDENAAKVHDKVFLAHWADAESEEFTGFDFQVPGGIKDLNGEELKSSDFIALLRDLISILFDAKMF